MGIGQPPKLMSIKFSSEELELAQLLKAYGLCWTPEVGHYALDQAGLIECESPFQDRVFFILDLKHFLRRSQSIEGLVSGMCWLPTWEQARQVLREQNVDAGRISEHLKATNAIARGDERLELYRLIESSITGEL